MSEGCWRCNIMGHAWFCACPCHEGERLIVFGEPVLGSRQLGPWGPGFDVVYDDGVIAMITRKAWTTAAWRHLAGL